VRRSAVVLALSLLASLGIAVPSAAASTSSLETKVVIIVGATHGATAGYRADADRAYAEAIKYTPDVTRVYSPNATWAKVKAATAGASIVIYMGHGNGWPSPYTYDPAFTTKDGFGLNATAGNGDANNKYYGEPYVSTLDLAPGAVVLLHHLCYASGNSEPGDAEPSVSVARQRADNFAAGFLKAGAAAVMADGHAGAESYLRALFTTHQSLESMWRTMPNQNGHVTSFASARTPGAIIFQDPNKATSGFYRSLAVGSVGATTDEVVAGGLGDTGSDPSALQIPGNGSVVADGASLYATPDAPEPDRSLPAGTRLRVIAAAVAPVDGEPISLVEVAGIDDPSIAGFVRADDLIARDSRAPLVRAFTTSGPFSPNGDDDRDTTTISTRFSESVTWTLEIRDALDAIVFDRSGDGESFEVVWKGLMSGVPLADGTYQLRVAAVDGWRNGPVEATESVVIDSRAPVLASLSPDAATTQWFSPNGDGVRDQVDLIATNPDPGAVLVKVRDGSGALIDKWTVDNGSDPVSLSWDGRTTAGAYAADGTYSIIVLPQDLAGNTGTGVARSVELVAALRSVATSRAIFFPQDLDGLAATADLSFVLQRPMTVSWVIRDAAGGLVVTHLDAVDLPSGTHAWTFDGRDDEGAMLPRGAYSAEVVATDGGLTASQSVGFTLAAFALRPSDSTPARGQTITVTVDSAEALSGAPRLVISQPGVSRRSVLTSKVGRRTYRVTVRLKDSGQTGALVLKAKGFDKHGRKQSTSTLYTLH
jgi:flagellar hook assembly protein FlgD